MCSDALRVGKMARVVVGDGDGQRVPRCDTALLHKDFKCLKLSSNTAAYQVPAGRKTISATTGRVVSTASS
jgi:hypothetical protein